MPNFTHYRQHDGMDCGPTCLRMVAKHYGRTFSIQKLREATQIGKEGVSLLGISEAAESIGLKTLAAKTTLANLVKDAPLHRPLETESFCGGTPPNTPNP